MNIVTSCSFLEFQTLHHCTHEKCGSYFKQLIDTPLLRKRKSLGAEEDTENYQCIIKANVAFSTETLLVM